MPRPSARRICSSSGANGRTSRLDRLVPAPRAEAVRPRSAAGASSRVRSSSRRRTSRSRRPIASTGSRSTTSRASSNPGARAITSPSSSSTTEWPSKTSSSWPPTRLQKARYDALSRARVTSISSRSSALPTWNGEAERFTISWAPASERSVAGGPGCQMSSQIVGPTSTSPQPEQNELAPGGKVAVLVEDAVVRQVLLAVDTPQLPSREHGTRIGEVALEERAADEGRDPLGRSGDLVEGRARSPDEARSQEQVLRWVPRDRELGKDDEVGAGGMRLTDRVDDEGAVAGDVTDDRVELGEGEPHARRLTFSTARHKLHSSVMLAPLTIARRFRGPRTSANGGYAAGLLAQAFGDAGRRGDAPPAATARAAARRRPRRRAPAPARRRRARRRGATGRPRVLRLRPLRPSRRRRRRPATAGGWGAPEFDECFVCGTRPEEDGLEIHAGRVPGRDDGLVATTWVASGVRPEIVWAAIDCPGAYTLRGEGRGEPLLARITARIDRLPEEGERCVVAALAARSRRAQAACRDGALRGRWRRAGRLAASSGSSRGPEPSRTTQDPRSGLLRARGSPCSNQVTVRGVRATSSPPSSS